MAEKRIDFTYDDAGQYATITRYTDLDGTELVATSTWTGSIGWLGAPRTVTIKH